MPSVCGEHAYVVRLYEGEFLDLTGLVVQSCQFTWDSGVELSLPNLFCAELAVLSSHLKVQQLGHLPPGNVEVSQVARRISKCYWGTDCLDLEESCVGGGAIEPASRDLSAL